MPTISNIWYSAFKGGLAGGSNFVLQIQLSVAHRLAKRLHCRHQTQDSEKDSTLYSSTLSDESKEEQIDVNGA